MLSSTNSNYDSRVSQNYRMPNQQKRLPCIDGYKTNGHLRSNSPNPKRYLTGRRHSTPHLTGRTPTEIKSSQPNTMLKDYHPESSKIKERTPISNRPERRFSRRRSRSLVKRYPYPDDRTMPITPSLMNTDVIIPLSSNRSLHRITEASTYSTSETPSTNYDPITRKLWTQRSQKRVHDSQPADDINSDDETFSESVRSRSYRIKKTVQ